MATMPDPWPVLMGPPRSFDSSSRRVSFRRFLNALKAALSSCGLGEPGGGASAVDMGRSLVADRDLDQARLVYGKPRKAVLEGRPRKKRLTNKGGRDS